MRKEIKSDVENQKYSYMLLIVHDVIINFAIICDPNNDHDPFWHTVNILYIYIYYTSMQYHHVSYLAYNSALIIYFSRYSEIKEKRARVASVAILVAAQSATLLVSFRIDVAPSWRRRCILAYRQDPVISRLRLVRLTREYRARCESPGVSGAFGSIPSYIVEKDSRFGTKRYAIVAKWLWEMKTKTNANERSKNLDSTLRTRSYALILILTVLFDAYHGIRKAQSRAICRDAGR